MNSSFGLRRWAFRFLRFYGSFAPMIKTRFKANTTSANYLIRNGKGIFIRMGLKGKNKITFTISEVQTS